eukprot:366569-Chlamydomonas_euryale.AAC.42
MGAAQEVKEGNPPPDAPCTYLVEQVSAEAARHVPSKRARGVHDAVPDALAPCAARQHHAPRLERRQVAVGRRKFKLGCRVGAQPAARAARYQTKRRKWQHCGAVQRDEPSHRPAERRRALAWRPAHALLKGQPRQHARKLRNQHLARRGAAVRHACVHVLHAFLVGFDLRGRPIQNRPL